MRADAKVSYRSRITDSGAAHLDSPLLTDPEKQKSSHPKVISHLDTGARADLELPLGGHDLGVDTRDRHTGVQTCSLHEGGQLFIG